MYEIKPSFYHTCGMISDIVLVKRYICLSFFRCYLSSAKFYLRTTSQCAILLILSRFGVLQFGVLAFFSFLLLYWHSIREGKKR